jgi:hypothetical protein
MLFLTCVRYRKNENGDPKAAALKLYRSVTLRVQAKGTAMLRSGRRIMKPTPPKSISIIAHVAGSGTDEASTMLGSAAPTTLQLVVVA